MRHSKAMVVLSLFCLSAIAVAQNGQPTVGARTKAALNNSIAVMPFENSSPNPNDAYFAVGFHQEILDHLAKIRDINVVPSISVVRYKDKYMPISQIAYELNVETIMMGRVLFLDNQFDIFVQLINASNNNVLWSTVYNRELSDIFTIQAEIVGRIVTALGAELSAAEQERIDKVPTQSLEAYAFYLKARALTSNIRPGMPAEFYKFLEQAIEIDADFALAHALIASGYGVSRKVGRELNGLSIDEVEKMALDHAEIALALDPNLGYAYMAQGFVHQSNWRASEGRQAFERALQLSPHDVEILDEYARLLSFFGENDEAIPYAQRVLELAPSSGPTHDLMGWLLFHVGNMAAAADSFRKTIELMPSRAAPHSWLGFIDIFLGDNIEALKELRIAEQLADKRDLDSVTRIAYAYSKLGLSEEAMRIFKQLEKWAAEGQFIRPSAWATTYLAIGEHEKVYDILSQNLSNGDQNIQYLKFNAMKDPVLDEPRFVELRNRIGMLN